MSSSSTESDVDQSIGKTEVFQPDELTQNGQNEYGPIYECPRCPYDFVSEYCDCPLCGWAGMCQEEFNGSEE